MAESPVLPGIQKRRMSVSRGDLTGKEQLSREARGQAKHPTSQKSLGTGERASVQAVVLNPRLIYQIFMSQQQQNCSYEVAMR